MCRFMSVKQSDISGYFREAVLMKFWGRALTALVLECGVVPGPGIEPQARAFSIGLASSVM